MTTPRRLLPLLLLAACAPPADAPVDQAPDDSVGGLFAWAAERQDVPEELLLAFAWHSSSFDPWGDAEHDSPWIGWLGLTEHQLLAGAALAGVEPAAALTESAANLAAGAALMRASADPDADAALPGAAWWSAVSDLAPFDESWLRDELALSVFETVQEGLDVVTPDGEAIRFPGQELPDLEDIDPEEGPMEEEDDFASGPRGWPGRARYLAAHPNGDGGRRSQPIRRIVIHTTEGSYEGSISWARNPSSHIGFHYIVRRSDGQVTQMVPDDVVGWQACGANSDSVGIEHEGHASSASTWTDAMLDSSARLTGWLARTYNLPVDRQHIVGHAEVSGSGCPYRSDPGAHFPWTRYLKKVKEYKTHGGAARHPKAKITVDLPSNGQQVGNPFISRVRTKRAHHISVYLGARRVRASLRGDPMDIVLRPGTNGWKRLQVRAYARDGVEVGRKTLRVQVRRSSVDVEVGARKIHQRDYLLSADAEGAAFVRYWTNGLAARDKLTRRLRARPEDFELVRHFGGSGQRLVVGRAYREDGRLVGEGWRTLTVTAADGVDARLDQIGADELVGTVMRAHAEGDPAVTRVRYLVDGAPAADVDSGDVDARPSDYAMFVDFGTPGEHTLTAKAYDRAGNLRHTRNRTVHAPAMTLQVDWDRVAARRYRFDADPPAGTQRVLLYEGTELLRDAETGLGYAPGRAFRMEVQFDAAGSHGLSAVARDALGNVLGGVAFTVAVE